jgi:type IV secretory pathway TraG/TraD family ATPase VirD4
MNIQGQAAKIGVMIAASRVLVFVITLIICASLGRFLEGMFLGIFGAIAVTRGGVALAIARYDSTPSQLKTGEMVRLNSHSIFGVLHHERHLNFIEDYGIIFTCFVSLPFIFLALSSQDFMIGVYFVLWLLVVFCGFLAIRHFKKKAVESAFIEILPPRTRKAGNYGDAGWAYYQECIDFGVWNEWHDHLIYLASYVNPYEAPEGSSKWDAKPYPDNMLTYGGDSNLITIAPPRTGKGTTAIIPTLLMNNESTFVMDVKGENFFVTHINRFNRGHKIITINPFNLFGEEIGIKDPFTHCYNPLQNLDPNSPKFVSEITSVANAIVIQGKHEQSHFVNRARDLVKCLIGYICSDEAELAAGNNNLPRIRQIMGFSNMKFAEYMAAAALSDIPLVRDNAGSFMEPTKEVQDVKATVSTQLDFLNNPQIAYFLSRSDFDFADMRKQAMTVYCMIPSTELEEDSKFARLIVQSLISTLSKKLPQETDRRVLIILDEQAQLGNMKAIEKAGALLNGYKVRIWSIFQGIAQIKALYDEAWETFLSNADIQQYLSPNDPTVQDILSKRIGNETITETQISHSSSSTTGGESNTDSRGQNIGTRQFGQAFLSPAEINGMPKDREMIFVKNLQYPVLGLPLKYYEQTPNERLFFGRDYAPHPTVDRDAYQWMAQQYKTGKLPTLEEEFEAP